ncbi:MAG: hypothetical protein ACOC4I_00725 [Spirochaetota bacterium]
METFNKHEILERIESGADPDGNMPVSLKALWHDRLGNWETAHDLSQQIADPAGARIHAYLHRVEGDIPNARYWYGRSGEELPDVSLEKEWDELLERALKGEI